MTVRKTALLLVLRVSLTVRALLFYCIHSSKVRQGLADLAKKIAAHFNHSFLLSQLLFTISLLNP